MFAANCRQDPAELAKTLPMIEHEIEPYSVSSAYVRGRPSVSAVFGSSLMHDYTDATATEQVVIEAQFATLMAVVMRSIWQFLDGILVGVWWLGIGLLLRLIDPRLSRLTLILAAVAAVGAFVNLVRLSLVRDVLLGVLFILWAAWWIAILLVFIGEPQASSRSLP
jgi:hypothetical protein